MPRFGWEGLINSPEAHLIRSDTSLSTSRLKKNIGSKYSVVLKRQQKMRSLFLPKVTDNSQLMAPRKRMLLVEKHVERA